VLSGLGLAPRVQKALCYHLFLFPPHKVLVYLHRAETLQRVGIQLQSKARALRPPPLSRFAWLPFLPVQLSLALRPRSAVHAIPSLANQSTALGVSLSGVSKSLILPLQVEQLFVFREQMALLRLQLFPQFLVGLEQLADYPDTLNQMF
jgi:hypothetical protein